MSYPEPRKIVGFAECDDVSTLCFNTANDWEDEVIALDDFGKKWFLTEAEAEAAIANRKN
jgi:hypothetical protein